MGTLWVRGPGNSPSEKTNFHVSFFQVWVDLGPHFCLDIAVFWFCPLVQMWCMQEFYPT